MLKQYFKKAKYISVPKTTESTKNLEKNTKANVPDGAWMKCKQCKSILYKKDVQHNLMCCPNCDTHYRLPAYNRIKLLVDENSFVEFNEDIESSDVLEFPGYDTKLKKLQEKTKLQSAVVTGEATIGGYKAVVAVMDSHFMMGSMGQAVGEKITLAIEKATAKKLPIIIFTASGGARMQEGIFSLMQMAKTSAALAKHHEANQLYVSVLTDPTTGGVTASFAMLGDVILAEPGALIGFAGRRVIEQTINQTLPDDFQTAEFLLKHGFIDDIVARPELKQYLSRVLRMHCAPGVGGVSHE